MDPSLKIIYNRLLNQFFKFTLWMMPAMGVVVLFRYASIGWVDLFYVYLAFAVGVFALFFLRKSIAPNIKMHLVASILLAAGFGGMYFLGLSGGHYFAVVSLIQVALIRGYRMGIYYTAVFFAVYALFAFFFVNNILHIEMKLDSYNQNVYSWLSNGVALLWLLVLSIFSAAQFKRLFDLTLDEMRRRQFQAVDLRNKSMRQLELLPVAVLILKGKSEKPYVNKAYSQAFGPLSGDNNYGFIAQVAENKQWQNTLAACEDDPGVEKVVSIEIASKEGAPFFATVYVCKIGDETEICIIDNTLTVKISKKFGELEKRFSVLLNTISEGVLILDENKQIVMYNESFRDMAMFGGHEIVGQNCSLFCVADKEHLFGESPGQRYSETILQRKNGESIPVEMSENLFSFYGKHYALLFVRDIRWRKKTESELIENRNKYKQLFEHLTAGYALHEIIVDERGVPADYRFVEANKSFEEIMDLGRDEIVGKTVREVMPGIEQKWIDIYGQVALTGKPMQLEDYWAHLDRHFNISVFSPSKNCFATVFNDVTIAKNAEAKILETQKMYSDLVEQAQSIIWKMDINGRYTYINSACERIFGFRQEEMLGHLFSEFMPLNNVVKDIEVFQYACKNQMHIKEYETFHLKKDGSVVPISVNSKPIINGSGVFVGLFGTANDLSLRFQAEKVLKESEHRFDLALTGANVGLWDWDIATERLYYSPMWKKMLGYEDSELENTLAQWKLLLAPEDRDRMDTYIDAFLTSKESSYEADFKMVHKSGVYVDILARGFLIRNENGAPVRFTGTHVDITEKKRIENELKMHKEQLETTIKKRTEDLDAAIVMLRQSNRNLKEQRTKLSETLGNLHKTQDQLIHSEKMASLGILIAGIAHEINNPINYISANLQGMKAFADLLPRLIEEYNLIDAENIGTKLPEIQKLKDDSDFDFKCKNFKDAVTSIGTGTDRIAAIVKSLRTISAPGSGEKTKTDINECIETSLSLLSHELKHGIAVDKHIGTAPYVLADKNRLSQVFINIVMNSIDAMGKKGTITIRSRYSESHDVIVVSITDSGPGISSEHIPHIFEPFYTTKPVGYGTGLGLYICYQIITELGGGLMVDNVKEGGACFYVSLPICPENE